MNRVLAAGIGLTVLGTIGYGVGVFVAYEGRAFSVTALMVGISFLAVGRSGGEGGGEDGE